VGSPAHPKGIELPVARLRGRHPLKYIDRLYGSLQSLRVIVRYGHEYPEARRLKGFKRVRSAFGGLPQLGILSDTRHHSNEGPRLKTPPRHQRRHTLTPLSMNAIMASGSGGGSPLFTKEIKRTVR